MTCSCQFWRDYINFTSLLNTWSTESIKTDINLSIDKSIKIDKSDLIDIDCIDQSIEIGGTLV